MKQGSHETRIAFSNDESYQSYTGSKWKRIRGSFDDGNVKRRALFVD